MNYPNIYHFYHLYCGTNVYGQDDCWKESVGIHMNALHEYQLMNHLSGIYIGFVGLPHQRNEAKQFLLDKYKKAKWFVRIMEKMWEDLVGHIRKTVVIKTKQVVLDNIISNYVTLMWRGMGPIQALKYMDEGRILMNQYRKDVSTVNRLGLLKKSGLDYNKAEYESALRAIESNPINKLVKQGQFQSIIDDVDVEMWVKENKNIFFEALEIFVNRQSNQQTEHFRYLFLVHLYSI